MNNGVAQSETDQQCVVKSKGAFSSSKTDSSGCLSISLCGLPRCGKTTVGKALAQALGFTFIDTDHLIEQAFSLQFGESLSKREIFIRRGESFFRALEKQQIQRLLGTKRTVIAVGGGAVQDPDNAKTLSSLGLIAYLKIALEALISRFQHSPIPPYLDPFDLKKSLSELANRRTAAYEKIATSCISVDSLSIDEIVERLCSELMGNRMVYTQTT